MIFDRAREVTAKFSQDAMRFGQFYAELRERVAQMESLRGELAVMKSALAEITRGRTNVALGH